MDFGSLPTIAVTAAVTALVSLAIGKLSSVRRVFGSGLRSVGRALNYGRRFAFASRRTWRHARADFVSRRRGLSLPVLGITLFRWYDKHPDLIEQMLRVLRKNRSENVRREVARLLWDRKPASKLRVNDIVHTEGGTAGHVLWVDTEGEQVLALVDVSDRDAQFFHPARTAEVRIARGDWCPMDSCQYCTMTEGQVRTLGALWRKADEAERKASRLEKDVKFKHVRQPQDVDEVLDGLSDAEQIALIGGPQYEHAQRFSDDRDLPASTVGDLKALARSGWKLDVTRIAEHRHFSGVLVSRWHGPMEQG